MNKLSTSAHGVIDYMTAGLLFVLPYLFGWGPTTSWVFWGAAILLLGLSLMTRYELGLLKLVPMSVHLTMDMILGIALIVAPWVIGNVESSAMIAMIAVGLAEIGVSLITERGSSTRAITA
jgi:hypothetical protein